MATAAPIVGKYEPFPVKVQFNGQTRILQLKNTASYFDFCHTLLATFQQPNMTCLIRYVDTENDLVDVCSDFEFEEMCRQYHHGDKKAPLRVLLDVTEPPIMPPATVVRGPAKEAEKDNKMEEEMGKKLADQVARGLLRNGGAPFLQRNGGGSLDKDELKQALAEIEQEKLAAEKAKSKAWLRNIGAIIGCIIAVQCVNWTGSIVALVIVGLIQYDNIMKWIDCFNQYVKEKERKEREEKEAMLQFAAHRLAHGQFRYRNLHQQQQQANS
jgi:hypothetical protein